MTVNRGPSLRQDVLVETEYYHWYFNTFVYYFNIPSHAFHLDYKNNIVVR